MRNIDDAVSEWHGSEEDGQSLHAFLDMSWDSYTKWASGKMSPEELATYGYYEE